jgi:hypothetical protein
VTTIGPDGKIVTNTALPVQQAPIAAAQSRVAPAVSKATHVIAAVLASVAAFALTPAGQALIAQYPHLAVVSGLVATLASLYKAPSAD